MKAIMAVLITALVAAPDMTLNTLIEQARAAHPRLAASRARHDRAVADVSTARSQRFPEVSLTSSLARSEAEQETSRTRTDDLNKVQFGLSQRLYDFGQTSARVTGAEERERAAVADVMLLDSDIVHDVTQAYVAAVLADSLLVLRRDVVATRAQLRDHVRVLVEAGVRPRSDLTRVEIDLQSARLELGSAEASAAMARYQLREAVGVDALPEAPLEALLERTPAVPDIAELARLAPARRLDLLALRRRRDASQADIEMAIAQRRPVLSGATSATFRERRVDNVAIAGGDEFYAGLTLGWSGFNFKGVGAAIDASKADLRQNEASIEDLERTTRNEVWLAGRSLIEAIGRAAGAVSLVATTNENLTRTRYRYEAGLASILDVADAQVRYSDSRASLLSARASAWQAAAQLVRRSGAPCAGLP